MQRLFTRSIFRKWQPSTNVLPKKGMLVSRILDRVELRRGYGINKSEGYVLIVDVLADDYGRCKFQYLSGDKIEWTDWMTKWSFNRSYDIKNPWI